MSFVLAQKAKDGMSRDEILALRDPLDYSDGMTKQSYADSTDINKIFEESAERRFYFSS